MLELPPMFDQIPLPVFLLGVVIWGNLIYWIFIHKPKDRS